MAADQRYRYNAFWIVKQYKTFFSANKTQFEKERVQ